MNRMGQQPDGVLVSRRYLQETLLDVGDPITLHVSTDGTNNVEVNATIVGVYDYFPTVYEDELLTVVGNLDHLLTVSGGVATYNIWMRMDEWTVDTFELRRALSEVAPYTSHYQDVWTLVQQERDQKERVGVYGTLTLGFLASLALSGWGCSSSTIARSRSACRGLPRCGPSASHAGNWWRRFCWSTSSSWRSGWPVAF